MAASSATAAGEPTRPPMAAAVANAVNRRRVRLMASSNLSTIAPIVTPTYGHSADTTSHPPPTYCRSGRRNAMKYAP
jgi:hypothetical protein